MRRVLIPVSPGVFSAAGLLLSGIEHEFVRTQLARGGSATVDGLRAAYGELEADAERALLAEGVATEQIELTRFADVRYAGQAYELTLPVAAGVPDLVRIASDFNDEHARTYGHSSVDAPIDVVNVKLTARARPTGTDRYEPLAGLGAATAERTRTAYFGPRVGAVDVAVIARAALLDGPPREGPVIVEEYDATCVIPPGCRVTLDTLGNLDIDVVPEGP
jgi:N-methylhydantoinase A